MIDNTKTAEIFEQCAKELEDGIWIQKQSGHKATGRCAVRVIHDVVLSEALNAEIEDFVSVFADVRKELQAFLKLPPRSSIMVWNDVRGRTKGQVIDAFIGCAKELRNKG